MALTFPVSVGKGDRLLVPAEKPLMHRLALNLAHSKAWALAFCSKRWWFNLGTTMALKGPNGGTAP